MCFLLLGICRVAGQRACVNELRADETLKIQITGLLAYGYFVICLVNGGWIRKHSLTV